MASKLYTQTNHFVLPSKTFRFSLQPYDSKFSLSVQRLSSVACGLQCPSVPLVHINYVCNSVTQTLYRK